MLFLIGGFFNLLGILFISSGTGLIGYLLITRVEQFSSKLNSPVLPTLVSLLKNIYIYIFTIWFIM
jgi:hypothetical protein